MNSASPLSYRSDARFGRGRDSRNSPVVRVLAPPAALSHNNSHSGDLYARANPGYRFAVLSFFVALTAGCEMQGGREFDAGDVEKIERGVTTKATFGNTSESRSPSPRRKAEETWSYIQQKGPNALQSVAGACTRKFAMSGKSLTIVFTGDTVKDYTLHISGGT